MLAISSSVQTAIISALLALINTNKYLNYVALIRVHLSDHSRHCMF